MLGDNQSITNGSRTSAWTGTLADDVTTQTVSATTKLSSLGVSSGVLKVYDNGNWINSAIHIDENTTVADFLAACNDYGITAELNGDKISISTDSDKYIANETSNLVSKLGLANKSQTTTATYEQTDSKALALSYTHTTDATTTLKDLGFNDGANLRLEINGVQQVLAFAGNESVQDIIDTLEVYGVDASINNGTFSASSTTNTFKLTGTLADKLMGSTPSQITTSVTNNYQSKELNSDGEAIADTNTKLVNLGVDTGYINVIKDGAVTGSISIDENTTVNKLFRALSVYGINGAISADGKITLESIGNVSISDATSNAVSALGITKNNEICTYQGTTMVMKDDINTATKDTLLTSLNQPGQECAGALYLKLTDQYGAEQDVIINIDNTDSIGSFMQKLELYGITTSFENGIVSFHYGLGTAEVTGGDSAIMSNLGFVNRGLETWMQNDNKLEFYEDEVQTLSICNYVDVATKLGDLGVSDGEFTILYDGLGTKIAVNGNDTIGGLMSKISDATGNNITASLSSDGRLILEGPENIDINIGTSTDTTNLASIFNLFKESKNSIEGQTPLYKVSGNSKITTNGIFRLGNVSEGTFTIGNATFSITADTTIDSLIREINYSENAGVRAYWDEINGKMIITSETMGASYVNIQGGTSNFTDIFGLTTTQSGQEKLVTQNQTLGQNAILTINGAKIISTSNTITSDISKIEGLTINIKDVTPNETVTISVEQDTQSILDATKEAINSYNELISNLNDAVAIDGELHNDIALKSIKNEISRLATSAATNGTIHFRNLASIGITTAKASSALTTDIYSLAFDEKKFKEALETSENDVKLLVAGTIANPGILTKMEEIVDNALGSAGYFSSKTNSLNKQISSLDKKILRAELQTSAYKSLLERKFQNMESVYSSMANGYNSLFSVGI